MCYCETSFEVSGQRKPKHPSPWHEAGKHGAMGSKPKLSMERLSFSEELPKAAWTRSSLGQGSVWSLSCDLECSAEGEGLISLRTNRQGKPQLSATCCPSSFQIHTSDLSTFQQGEKKNQIACKCSGSMVNKVFFSASSMEIKQFLSTIITSAFSQLCAGVRA